MNLRFGNSRRLSLWLTLIIASWILACSEPASAQLEGRIVAKPIGVGYVRDITQVSMFRYMLELSKRLEIGNALLELADQQQERLENIDSKVETPITGTAWHMVQGLIPTFKTITFQEVVDEADARRLLNARKEIFGNNSSVDNEGDGRFRLVQSNSWTSPVPSGQDPQEYVDSINARNANQTGGSRQSASLVEENGTQVVEQSWSRTEYFCFHDNLLYSSDFEELWDMDLPARDSLTSNVSASADMGLEAFFDRIPQAIKMLGWNMLSASAGTQMQQRDGEEKTLADLRHSAIRTGLDIIQSIMFDIQETHGFIRLADDEQQAVTGEISFETRRNSGLTKQLEELSAGPSRFAAILNDDAAATFHLCFRISDEAGQLPQAAAAWLPVAANEAWNGNPLLVDAVKTIAESVHAFAENRVIELMLKAAWTDDTGGVIFGGLQLGGRPGLLQAVHTLLLNTPNAPSNVNDVCMLTESEGYQTLLIRLPSEAIEEIAAKTSLRLTHIYLVQRNSCLWFAAGTEESVQMIHQAADRCEAGGALARTPLLSGSVDVERWLAYPQDDASGVGGLLTWLDANRPEFPPSPFSMQFAFRGAQSKPTPLLQRCIDLGGETITQFQVIADRGGVKGTLRMGEAIANYYLARTIDAQDSMRQRALDQQREVEERLKAAEKQLEEQRPSGSSD